jgi:hypothetical protein
MDLSIGTTYELQAGAVSILVNEDFAGNIAIIGRCGEGKTIAAKTFIQHQRNVHNKRIIIVSPEWDYNSFVEHNGGVIYSHPGKLMYTDLDSLACISLPRGFSARTTTELSWSSVLQGLYLSIPSLKGRLDFIVIDEGQFVINDHFDLFMDCIKLANENGIRILLVVQTISRILDDEEMGLFTKSFNELLAFQNHEEQLQRYTKDLQRHEAIHFQGDTNQMHILKFDPSAVATTKL